jgi:hypothetical protein
MRWHIGVVAATFLAGASPASAQRGLLQGVVTDRETGKPLAGAEIRIAGTSVRAHTDSTRAGELRRGEAGQLRRRVRWCEARSRSSGGAAMAQMVSS